MTSRDYLMDVISVIENHPFEKLSVASLSKEVYLSPPHLKRMFKLVTGQSLMSYVRGRKLACSLDDLLNTDLRIIDIAQKYAFQHEQSYIRAFCGEYGCTPGDARKNKRILRILEAIDTKALQENEGGVLYGPEVVKVPAFSIMGKPHMFIGFDYQTEAYEPNKLAKRFYYEESGRIPNVMHSDVYIAYVSNPDTKNNNEYMPSLQVKNLSYVPDGFVGRKFKSHLYVRFRYIGEHHYEDINMTLLQETYAKIDAFFNGQTRYCAEYDYFFERIDMKLYDGVYCQMEWLYPVKDTLAANQVTSERLGYHVK